MIRILALLLAGLMLLLSQCGGKKEHLYTEKQVLRQLEETYGEEFAVVDCREVSKEYVGGTYAHRGNIYTLSPAADPALTFEVWDFIRTTEFNLGGPASRRYHSLGVFYVDAALERDMGELCREWGIEMLDGKATNLKLSAEGWEEQVAALGEFFEGCNHRGPYNKSGTYVVSILTLRFDTGRGTVARCDASFWDEGVYGLSQKRLPQTLKKLQERNRAVVEMAFPLWEFLGEKGLDRALVTPWGEELAYEDERDPWARMEVRVETEEELDEVLALLEEFAADLPENPAFSAPGALELEEEVELTIRIKQFLQRWHPFSAEKWERLTFDAGECKARFENSMFWEREITGRDPDLEGEQETVTIGEQGEPEDMGTAALEQEGRE